MKANKYITRITSALIFGILLFASCSQDEDVSLSSSQQALIGKGVHFEPYVYGFKTRAFNHDGFNQNDVFYICRQALDEETGQYEQEEPWKNYFFKAIVDPAGNITNYEWVINLTAGAGFQGNTQTNSDSIFWENGKQVRFRAYSKSSCCDDYLYADYAYVSGPMGSVPLEFKHLGCRIGFAPYSGNTITSVDYCTDPADYMREDNADSHSGADENDKMDSEKAAEIAKEVETVFNKICMPGGLALYSDAGNNWYERDNTTGAETSTSVEKPTPQYGVLTAKAKKEAGQTAYKEVTAEHVTTDNTERPNWETNMDGIRYCIMIPYEMNGDKAGTPITIPAETRFKIRLKDVNTNDAEQSIDNNDKDNGGYHIFSLSDIKVLGENGEPKKGEDGKPICKYPEGITLRAGYSYTFYVGYHYNKLEVRVNEEGINWNSATNVELNASATNKSEQTVDYSWWSTEMNRAADEAMTATGDKFEPIFKIENKKQWLAFTNIVNGVLPTQTITITNEDGTTEEKTVTGIPYNHFYPTNGIQPKHVKEEVLTDPFPFTSIKVQLLCDIDFEDTAITSIASGENKFNGFFDGNGHTLSNFSGTVFGNISRQNEQKDKPYVIKLFLKSTQNISLATKADGAIITAISVEGPSTHAITTTCNNSQISACCHVGIGNNNGSLLGTGEKNEIAGSFIAAAGKGYLTDTSDDTFGTFKGCYFDRTISPTTTAWGIQYPDDVDEYEARGVLSQTLRAVNDQIHPTLVTQPNLDYYYGLAPFKAMNNSLGEATSTYYYHMNTQDFNDRYPQLIIK